VGRAHPHHHHHHHHARASGDRRALTIALSLILALMAAEVVFGIVASSLALVADAGHMLTDAGALGFAVAAATLAARPARGPWTYGLARLEILSAQANGITLGIVGIVVATAAVWRLVSPPDVRGGIVAVVAALGIVVNLAASAVLARASRESLNVRGAFLHVATDVVAFAGTAVAGVLIVLTGWDRFDAVASLLVAGLMFWSSASLVRESTRIFMEGAPRGIDPEAVGRALAAEPDVVQVHDLHVWEVTSGFPSLSAHVLVEGGADCHAARRRLEQVLAERFGLTHTTLQVDHDHSGGLAIGVAVRRETPLE
jgi:cobalt-zinc-cadmium efflux system protein